MFTLLTPERDRVLSGWPQEETSHQTRTQYPNPKASALHHQLCVPVPSQPLVLFTSLKMPCLEKVNGKPPCGEWRCLGKELLRSLLEEPGSSPGGFQVDGLCKLQCLQGCGERSHELQSSGHHPPPSPVGNSNSCLPSPSSPPTFEHFPSPGSDGITSVASKSWPLCRLPGESHLKRCREDQMRLRHSTKSFSF